MYIRHKLGSNGEEIACDFLKKSGYKIIEKNYRCKIGEIDIIACDKDELVFVEVKTRTQKVFGSPVESVNDEKKNHIYRVAQYYITTKKLEQAQIRFDVIEIYIKNNEVNINLIKNAILDRPKGCEKW